MRKTGFVGFPRYTLHGFANFIVELYRYAPGLGKEVVSPRHFDAWGYDVLSATDDSGIVMERKTGTRYYYDIGRRVGSKRLRVHVERVDTHGRALESRTYEVLGPSHDWFLSDISR
jgi:hypothetical protein